MRIINDSARRKGSVSLPALFAFLLLCALSAFAQTTAFTYQGRLSDASAPAAGTYDFQFALYDAASDGRQQSSVQTVNGVSVVNGVFTVQLDFGSSAFPGSNRYLEIRVKKQSEASYTPLSPRQQITSNPYSIRSLNAASADYATNAGTATTATNATNATNAANATTATTANSATNFSGALAGDVTGTQSATTISTVGGVSASIIAGGAAAANSATDANTAGTIVKRDASGNFAAGTITATINGNASTATTSTNFSGSLAGDVTGTQSATTVSTVGGVSASNISSGVTAANNATDANTSSAIVKRDAGGNFSAGTITANLNGNATTATTATNATTASGVSASAGDSVVTAINAGSSTINSARLPSTLATQNGANTFSGTNNFITAPTFSAGLAAGNQRITGVATPTSATDAATKAYVDAATATGSYVQFAPSTQQTTSTTNHLINLKLIGARNLGTAGQDSLLSLSASGTYWSGGFTQNFDKERFRVENDGSILAVSDYNSGCCGGIPIEGSGTRFLWFGAKAAIRAGGINGTQWDDANIGLYSTAFGENVRALGDNAIAVGKNTVAANTGTVALGEGHSATGANSIALGYGASTSTSAGSPRLGTFVFADRSTVSTCPLYSSGNTVDTNCQFHPTVTNSFNVRAVNGSFFYTNIALSTGFIFNSTTATMTLTNSKLTMASDGSTTLTSNPDGSAGVALPAGGGSWNNLSDRNVKENFASVNSRDILRKVLNLPISTWNYKTQNASVRHIGAMAQDFKAAFAVGEDDKHISTIDPDGVALAAIQGLNEELKDRDVKIEQQQQQLNLLQEQVRQQQIVIDGLKKLLCANNSKAEVCRQ
jgi:hypothetical protein